MKDSIHLSDLAILRYWVWVLGFGVCAFSTEWRI